MLISCHNFYASILICRVIKYSRFKPYNSKNVTSLRDHKPFFDSHSSICLFQCFGKNHCSGLQGFGAPIFLHRWRRWSQSLGYSGKKNFYILTNFVSIYYHLLNLRIINCKGHFLPLIQSISYFDIDFVLHGKTLQKIVKF